MKKYILLFFTGISFCFYSQKTENLNLYFYLGDFNLTLESQKKIDSLMNIHLGGHFEITTITAFTDPSGRSESNKMLASNRAKSVNKVFESFKIPISKTIIIGENYNQDLIESNDYKNWRKVVVEFTYDIPEVVAVDDTPKNIFGELTVEDIKEEKGKTINLSIEFVPGEAILLNDSSFAHVYQFYEFMRYNENVHAFIRGHVCCADDLILSSERANLVYMELVRRGISPKRLSFKGFSNSLPLASPEINDQDRQKNRRVDIIFSVPTEE